MTIETNQSTNRQYAEGVSPLTQVREYPMSESKFTPGPWYADGPFVGTEPGRHNIVSGVSADIPEDEAERNANLIAAAPDILEALEQIATGRIRGGAEHSADASRVRARIAQEALAKARGESHD